MPNVQDVTQLQGCDLVDQDGDKIGSISDIYVDNDTDRPEWALVSGGLFGTKSHFVPLASAEHTGDKLRVPYDKDMVKGAPSVVADGELSQQEEAELYSYYGIDYSEDRSESGLPDRDADTRGRGTDDAMTRSEEEVRVGTRQHEAGRARLRKYVVTENVTETVPVRREEVHVEREPITDANRDEALSGPEITESEHEVTLTEEQPVVEKRTVPKERVRLEKDVVSDEETVSADVRKEQIETSDVERRPGA